MVNLVTFSVRRRRLLTLDEECELLSEKEILGVLDGRRDLCELIVRRALEPLPFELGE